MFEYRVLSAGTQTGACRVHPDRIGVRAPDGSHVGLPTSVVLQMIEGGHSFVRGAPGEGLAPVATIDCRACGGRALDLGCAAEPIPFGPGLTPREQEIFGLLAQGLTNRQISRRLWIAEGTVKAHVGSVLRKLGVTNRTQAVVGGLQASDPLSAPSTSGIRA